MGFGEIEDFADCFAIFDIGEKGGGGEVPSTDDIFALYGGSAWSVPASRIVYYQIISSPVASQVLLCVHDQTWPLSEILLEKWIA